MSAQTSYGFVTPVGIAGGLVDLTDYTIDTRINAENNGVLKFGLGLVKGTAAGVEVKLPASTSTAADFEGIAINNRTREWNLDGSSVYIFKKDAVGVLRYGRAYGRIEVSSSEFVSVAYGDPVYLITQGDYAGYFTKNATTGGNANVKLNARFIGSTDATNGVAAIEFFAPAQTVDAGILPIATTTTVGVVSVGTGLDVSAAGAVSVHTS